MAIEADLAEAVEDTVAAVRPRCADLAARVAEAPVTMMLGPGPGPGPGYGSARYAAAKVIEAAGVYAAGQDLEEWEHVETLAGPPGTPTFVIAAPGRRQAIAVAARARARGRLVVAAAVLARHRSAPRLSAGLPFRRCEGPRPRCPAPRLRRRR
ncbi:hypothetical protein [Nonomuraea sp. NPDC050643]|uniref:hypothetical protein n=1 Tax=Nonomuraea sp. NPDC050643 TaxID=3155660 RepID=UPI0033DEE922